MKIPYIAFLIAICVIVLTPTFSAAHVTHEDTLRGMGLMYDYTDSSKKMPKRFKVNSKLFPSTFYFGKKLFVFEKTSIANIANQYGCVLRKNHSKNWVCYNSKSDGKTYWFISDMLLGDGYLTSVIIGKLDLNSECNTPNKTLARLTPNVKMLSLNSTRNQVLKFYGISQYKNHRFLTVYQEDDGYYGKLRRIDYIWSENKTVGIIVTQISST